MHVLVDVEKWNKMSESLKLLNLEVMMMRRVMGDFGARLDGLEVAQGVPLNPLPSSIVESELMDMPNAGDIQIGYKHEEKAPIIKPLTEGSMKQGEKKPSPVKPIAAPPAGNVVQFPPKR